MFLYVGWYGNVCFICCLVSLIKCYLKLLYNIIGYCELYYVIVYEFGLYLFCVYVRGFVFMVISEFINLEECCGGICIQMQILGSFMIDVIGVIVCEICDLVLGGVCLFVMC